jgi:UDP-GlcNAc3NAcA epimerase
MKKLVTIVGARPQFVKLAPFSREVRKVYREVIVHTGQHYDENMSDAFFADLGIPEPDRHLQNSGSGHGRQTGRMLESIEEVLLEERPDGVVVFGDTNSTLAGALAAVKLKIPTVHVEAGLRSFNRGMPEEINRVLADHASDLLFAPTAAGMANLAREGLASRAVLTGDIMVDALEGNCARAEMRSDILRQLGLDSGGYALLTLHRPYTVDNPSLLRELLEKIGELGVPVVFPVHPRTRKTLETIGYWAGEEEAEDVSTRSMGVIVQARRERRRGMLLMIDPAPYLDFLCLQKSARMVLTDSGGVQKEAYILRKPCITLRPETEWTETVDAGWNRVIPPDAVDLVEQIQGHKPPVGQSPVFGEDVAQKMVAALETLFVSSSRQR